MKQQYQLHMKSFKFFRDNDESYYDRPINTRYYRTILPTGERLARVEDERKHIAVICPSGELFHQLHRQLRVLYGLPESVDFYHSRFILNDNQYYLIRRPDDVNGLIFTHYLYHHFNVSENPWAITIVEYLVHEFNVLPYIDIEPNRR